MELPELIKMVSDQGVAMVLAIVVIYWNRQETRERIEAAKDATRAADRRREQERQDKLQILEAYRDATRVMNELTHAVKDLGRR